MANTDLETTLAFSPQFNADGLIPAITQDVTTGQVLMLGWMNATSLKLTQETGFVTYWSRSRGKLWKKGEESGHVQKVVEMRVDCDQDAILLRVEAGGDGGACHTGRKSCFYRRVDPATGRLVFIES